MARRVRIRSRYLGTDVAQLEEMIQQDFKEIWKQHMEELEAIADTVKMDAEAIAPLLSGRLSSSIDVRVSRSNRFPGIIASASAFNHGYDYALIQEETEVTPDGRYDHDDGRMAHYLGGPFARELQYWYEEATGKELVLPENLQHALDYIESHGG